MTDLEFINYFGDAKDFENLKRWFRINSELYKELIQAFKERYELELDYSSRLAKIGGRILKAFNLPVGSLSLLWTKTAHNMSEESEVHKRLGTRFQEELYKPLVSIGDKFTKFKKPVENDIDKFYKTFQDKREEESKLKKKAFSSMKETEKSFENITEHLRSHSATVPGADKDKLKFEKRAQQAKEQAVKAETEYFEASLASEECRHSWEQSYMRGLEKLQKIETERLNSMKSLMEAYQKCISEIPPAYTDISNKILNEIQITNVYDDLKENAVHYTNRNPNVYKTEQYLLDLYSESKENQMDHGRRVENLKKRISSLHQQEKKQDNLRTGALKMLTVYDESPQYADEATKTKAEREYKKIQAVVNFYNANIYKLQCALNSFQQKPEPVNPLISLGMSIQTITDRNGVVQTCLVGKPGAMLTYDPGTISNDSTSESVSSNLNVIGDVDVFDSSSDEEPVRTSKPVMRQTSQSSGGQQSRPVSIRPLPAVPRETMSLQGWCQALHSFTGRDEEELSFEEGETITIKRKINNVWWEGEIRGKTGLIPVSYVKELLP